MEGLRAVRAAALITALLTLELAVPAAAVAAAAVTLEGSATVEFVDVAPARRARLAVKPSVQKPAKGDEPRVLELALGNLRDSDLDGALSVAWEAAPDGTPLALRLELKDTVRRPGTYRAVLAPLPKSRLGERLELQIVLTPAKLGLPEKLVVSRTLQWPFETAEVKQALVAREESRATRMSALEVSRVASSAAGLPVSVGITPGTAPVAIAADRQAEIPYALDTGFPLGTVTGKLRFSALELTNPVLLDYEVRTRLSSAYIPVIIGFGFLLGWLVRKRLAQLIQLGEARDLAARLLSPVAATLTERPDATFQQAVRPRWEQLVTARNGDDPQAIATAMTQLDQAWRAAVTEFGQRQTAALAALDELRALAAPPLPVPLATRPSLRAARDAAQRARASLDRNDVATAQNELGAVGVLAADVQTAALDWQDAMGRLLSRLRTAPLGLPSVVVTQFDDRNRTAPALDAIKPETPLATPSERRALFLAFHGEFRDARNRLAELSARLEAEWALIDQALGPVRGQLTPGYPALTAAAVAFRKELEGAADNPAALEAALTTRLQELDGHWRQGLLEEAPAAARPNLLPLYQKREFLQLAQEVVKVMPGALLGPAQPALVSGPWVSLAAAAPVAAADIMGSAAPGALAVPAPLEALTVHQARKLQSAVLAGLYIAVYWALNADTFGAQLSEVGTLLVTSFGLDLGVEGLLKLKK
ncbi:MAG: hypothetical protein HY726_18470 [Candidatus Rokubacteria bacterium]|nr:hypothetical protein [Candidatus Rokubacteria bacterium]